MGSISLSLQTAEVKYQLVISNEKQKTLQKLIRLFHFYTYFPLFPSHLTPKSVSLPKKTYNYLAYKDIPLPTLDKIRK